MNILRTMLIFGLLLTKVFAQDSTNANISYKFKLGLNLGICLINPKNVNDHISISNAITSSSASAIRSAPEMSIAFIYRPFDDNKIFILRAGYIWTERKYHLLIPETTNDPTITGYSTGHITEMYTAYPISIGFGLCSSSLKSQLQAELVYGLGYIKETQKITSSSGSAVYFNRTFFSPSYGARVAGSTEFSISKNVGINFEISYRFLVFGDYRDEKNSQPVNITFHYSGVNLHSGLSIYF